MFTTMYLFKWMNQSHFKRVPHQGKTRELDLWRKAAGKIHENAGEEEQIVKAKLLDYIKQLEYKLAETPVDSGVRKIDTSELEEKYVITDMSLFLKSCTVLLGVVILFFLHSFVEINLNLPWIAIIGAMVLLLVSGIRDIDEVLEKIELSTLLFFAGLFVLMRCMEELGVMDYIADRTADVIEQVPEGDGRLATAILMIIWVSAIVGAVIDNIPFTQTMIPVVVNLAVDRDLGLPLAPLVWALAFGCCFGGNATLIGASANVVAAGLAEQDGYPISFNTFFKYGCPAMFVSTATISVYMLFFHVIIPWY